jgi:adenylate kinase
MKVILLGAPGAGKGTQAEHISEKLGVPVIGTGNMIREQIKAATPTGLKAKGCVDAGNLVPDELVIEMLGSRILQPDCRNGLSSTASPALSRRRRRWTAWAW